MSNRLVGNKWDAVAVAINTDWFSANLAIGPSASPRPMVHTIQILLATTSVVSVLVTDGATAKSLRLNGGVAVPAAVLYSEDILIFPGQTYNIQHATGTQVVTGSISEKSN